MFTVIVVLLIVAVSIAVVVGVVVLDDPGPATPPLRPPQPRASTNRSPGRPGRPWWRREGRYFLEILAVSGFAVAQPVLGSFGDSPETFVATHASLRTIVMFGIGVAVLPALAVWALAAATGLVGGRARRVGQSAAVGLLLGLFISWFARPLLPGPAWVLVAAVAAGLAAAFLYERFEAARLYLVFLSAAPAAFLVVFLAFSPVANLIFTPSPASPPAPASPEAAAAGQPSFVVLVLDELPTMSLLDGDGRIDAELFPNLARFADDATFYRNTTTVATFTDLAVPSLLTGRIHTEAKAVRDDYVENLFTLLGDSHDLNVHEAITSLCPPSRCDQASDPTAIGRLLSLAWDLWTGIVTSPAQTSLGDGVGETSFEALLGLIAGRFEHLDDFLESLQPDDGRPQLDFAHLLLPHVPWQVLPDGQSHTGDPHPLGLLGPRWTTETAGQLGRQRHLLQLQYTDKQVGRMLDRLAELDRYDDSYVIVVADHGLSFQEEEFWRGVSRNNAHELLWVPLLIKAPGQVEGRITDVNTEIVDLVPTIADATGIGMGWEVDGRSLLNPALRHADDKRFVPSEHSTIEPDDGKAYATIDAVEGLANMLAAQPASAVPSDDPLALYRLPPHVEFTGTPVVELPQGPPADWKARLVDPEQYDDVDLQAPILPVYVSGEVEEADTELRRVVVAVNGVIGGWGSLEAHLTVWSTRFAVLVPESLLRPGANTVDVFAMEGAPGEVTLRPVELVR
ncbi:MAG TPA: sulfatase-like hydrolase/transferase [Acidimicrobiales bacterium]|nr:sulfatase-like hydrolase/transferase [Acidimicrobiales bacterium]